METAIKTVQKMTSKGQVTLPAFWRKRFATSQVIIETKKEKVEITPFVFPSAVASDITVCNANSASFDFLKDEPDLYSVNDLKKRYV